jgi:hypothetical protein
MVRGSNGGSSRRCPVKVKSGYRRLGVDFASQLIQHGRPLDAAEPACPKFVGGSSDRAGNKQDEGCQQMRDRPDDAMRRP